MSTLQVDQSHAIHYEVHGNMEGNTFLFIHGGPGLGTDERCLEFFDLKTSNVILFDQRGCGKSTPLRHLKNNTTQHLVDDIHRILDHLNIDKVYLFGGSWGSTLALLFSIQYPQKVCGVVLRGLFTATSKERRHFETGGTEMNYPSAWKRFLSVVPTKYHQVPFKYYFEQILGGDFSNQEKHAFEYSLYGYVVAQSNRESIDFEAVLRDGDYLTKSLLGAHYAWNDFFIPDHFIDHNMHKIRHLPIKLIQGIQDEITTHAHAISFCSKHKNVELISVPGGHSAHDPKIKDALIKAVQSFK